MKFLKQKDDQTWHYHRGCYSTFTSASKIKKLQHKTKKEKEDNKVEKSKLMTRSKTGKTDWDKCLLCQKDKSKEKLKLIMTKNMNEKIVDLSNFDYKLHVRASAVGDLIAAEGKYHSSCLLSFQTLKESWKTSEVMKQKENLPSKSSVYRNRA